jgi:hypothetical protein
MSGTLQGRIVIGWLVLAALAFVALRAPVLSMPLERDEGEYAYIGWRLLEGEVPYRDGFNQKPPGVFAVYAAAIAAFGRSVEGIRLVLYVWTAATAALLFLLVRRLADPLAAAAAILFFAVASVDPSLSALAANTELFMLLPLVGSVLCLERALATGAARWWLACGALGAAAFAFKQVAATQALWVGLVALVAAGSGAGGSPKRFAPRLARLGWLAAGAGAVVLPVIALFLAAGAAAELADAVVLHNLAYAQRRSLSEGLDNLAGALLVQAPSLALLWLAAAAGLLAPASGSRCRWLLGGWLVASLAGVAVGWQFRGHYFVQALPALAACAGLGAAAAVRAAARKSAPAALAAAGCVALAGVAVPAAAHRAVFFAGSPEAVSRAVYGLNPFPEAQRIADHIAANSRPDESVYVVGSEPQIPFLAGRRSATRYVIFYPLTGGYEGSLERQRELLAEVAAARPRYLVWTNVATSLLVSAKTEGEVFTRSRAMLRDYRLELLARPETDGSGYVFESGAAAARWLAEAQPAGLALPWVAVYRRVP